MVRRFEVANIISHHEHPGRPGKNRGVNYIKTGNASEAYRQVYDTNASAKTINEKASRLLAEGKVRARVEALQGKVTERAVEKTAISKAWVIGKLVEDD